MKRSHKRSNIRRRSPHRNIEVISKKIKEIKNIINKLIKKKSF
jgi:hypothetical protein